MRSTLLILTLLLGCTSHALASQELRANALTHVREGNWAAAESALEDVVVANPYDSMAHYYLAEALRRVDIRFDQSIFKGLEPGVAHGFQPGFTVPLGHQAGQAPAGGQPRAHGCAGKTKV